MTPEQFCAYVGAIIDTEYEKGREFERKALEAANLSNQLNGIEPPHRELAKIELLGPLGLIEKALQQVQFPHS